MNLIYPGLGRIPSQCYQFLPKSTQNLVIDFEVILITQQLFCTHTLNLF